MEQENVLRAVSIIKSSQPGTRVNTDGWVDWLLARVLAHDPPQAGLRPDIFQILATQLLEEIHHICALGREEEEEAASQPDSAPSTAASSALLSYLSTGNTVLPANFTWSRLKIFMIIFSGTPVDS
jgi:hypothetical protein